MGTVIFDMPSQIYFAHQDRGQVDAFTAYLKAEKPDAFAYLQQAKSIERLGQSDPWSDNEPETRAIENERQVGNEVGRVS